MHQTVDFFLSEHTQGVYLQYNNTQAPQVLPDSAAERSVSLHHSVMQTVASAAVQQKQLISYIKVFIYRLLLTEWRYCRHACDRSE